MSLAAHKFFEDTPGNSRKIRTAFYLLWLSISLLQAGFTQLMPDEAYYWTWSQHLAWGYFDHPPVIAAMIGMGYALFHNELGVRLLSVLFCIAFIRVLEILTRPKNLVIFYGTILSTGILHFYGYIAVPDMPLLLFTACFFYLYRNYLREAKAITILLLSLDISLMLMSKYHGILVVFFTVLSNPSLFKKGSFWIICLLAALCFMPHVYWEYKNGFPSIVFQLFRRAHESYNISLTLEYLATLPVFFGPVAGTVLLFMALKYKPEGLFEKALKYNLSGVLLFFALMTFKGRVEINWVNIALFPAFYLGFRKAEDNHTYIRTLKYSFFPIVFLVLVARIFIISDFLPPKWRFENDFHGYKEWASTIKAKSGGRPVLFMNSYQNASEYTFYTGDSTFTMNNMMGRKDQYSLWNYENEAQGKEVFLIPNYDVWGLESFPTARGIYQQWVIPDFRSSSGILIGFEDKKLIARPGIPFPVHIRFSLSGNFRADVESNKSYPAFLVSQFYDFRKMIKENKTDFRVLNKMFTNRDVYYVMVTPPEKKGKYHLYLSVKCGELPQSINSEGLEVDVE